MRHLLKPFLLFSLGFFLLVAGISLSFLLNEQKEGVFNQVLDAFGSWYSTIGIIFGMYFILYSLTFVYKQK